MQPLRFSVILLPNSELHIKRCQAFKKVLLKDDILIHILYNYIYINYRTLVQRVFFLKVVCLESYSNTGSLNQNSNKNQTMEK